VRDPGRLGGFEGPGVESGRRDGAQEGVGGDRVLVRRGEQQEQACGVGQGADLPAVPGQQLRRQGRRFGREGVEARGLAWGQAREEFGGGAWIAVDHAQDADADPFGERGVGGSPCVGARRWRSAV
jgi:hypothetical protein